jgi:hypothetical protein
MWLVVAGNHRSHPSEAPVSTPADTSASPSPGAPEPTPGGGGDNGPGHPWWLALALIGFSILWPVVAKLVDIDTNITVYVLASILGGFGISQASRR